MSADIAETIRDLSRPDAYPFAVDSVEVHQTHISAVFLVGEFAYKIKKPVDLGFLDFSTLDRRRHFCDEEVRLNRRLAPTAYLGVVPIVAAADGLRVEGDGPAVEWAVKMARLPAEADLAHRIDRGEIDARRMQSFAERIATFHSAGTCDARIASAASWEAVAGNANANFEATRGHVGETVSSAAFNRLWDRTRESLEGNRTLIERRAGAGKPRDTHGDLRLDHVYWFPERPPPDDWCILDCIEFNERFRHADPIADAAFLVMDLAFAGRWDLAAAFAEGYVEAANDREGGRLLPFYASYRAAVRGKVEGIAIDESEIPKAERTAALQRAKAHWLAALTWIESRRRRPMLLLVGGLPGSGKSTLARELARTEGFAVVRSDVVRKDLAGVAGGAAAEFGQGIYTPQWDDRTYGELQRLAAERLWLGERVLVDASFRDDRRRREFVDLAKAWGVPAAFLECRAPADVARERLRHRRDDASDADAAVYEAAARCWEPISPEVTRWAAVVEAVGSVEAIAERSRAAYENATSIIEFS